MKSYTVVWVDLHGQRRTFYAKCNNPSSAVDKLHREHAGQVEEVLRIDYIRA